MTCHFCKRIIAEDESYWKLMARALHIETVACWNCIPRKAIEGETTDAFKEFAYHRVGY
jgi:hydrogenase maturation factor HypF (carbamoyltransferase family)